VLDEKTGAVVPVDRASEGNPAEIQAHSLRSVALSEGEVGGLFVRIDAEPVSRRETRPGCEYQGARAFQASVVRGDGHFPQPERDMIDRQQLETLLGRRFPGTTDAQIAAAANGIMAMIATAGNVAVAENPQQKWVGATADHSPRGTSPSGSIVRQALRDRFEAIRKMELERFHKKLRGLSDAERGFVEAIMTDVVHAILTLTERALSDETSAQSLQAIVHLFALDRDPSIASR
jgi:hypothetical protein